MVRGVMVNPLDLRIDDEGRSSMLSSSSDPVLVRTAVIDVGRSVISEQPGDMLVRRFDVEIPPTCVLVADWRSRLWAKLSPCVLVADWRSRLWAKLSSCVLVADWRCRLWVKLSPCALFVDWRSPF